MPDALKNSYTGPTQSEFNQSSPRKQDAHCFPSICPWQQTRRWNQAGLKRQKAATTSHFSFKPSTVTCLINWCSSNIKLLLFDLNFWSLRKAR